MTDEPKKVAAARRAAERQADCTGVGASPGVTGTAPGPSQLRQAFAFTAAFCMARRELLVYRTNEKFDADGGLGDEATVQHRERFLAYFARG